MSPGKVLVPLGLVLGPTLAAPAARTPRVLRYETPPAAAANDDDAVGLPSRLASSIERTERSIRNSTSIAHG